ncbi:MAG: ABC transporter permease subunit [Isosphaeraceae bacterium]
MRSLTVSVLLGGMSVVWLNSTFRAIMTIKQKAEVGKTFYETTSILLLGLVGLAAPAATAGAVCLDKSRGNLTLLFATDLSNSEIVLGKLAARLVPVLGLILCAAPVLSIATLFGGIDPVGLAGALLVILSCAVFGCSLALTLSIWGKKTHEVLLATYAFGILYLLAAPIVAGIRAMLPPGWWTPWLPTFTDLLRYHPVFLILAAGFGGPPGMAPVTFETQATFFALGTGASILLIGASAWRIRTVVIRQEGRGATRRLTWPGWLPGSNAFPGLSLDGNPVLWRECQRKRPSGWGLAVWGAYFLICGLFSVYSISEMAGGSRWGLELGVVVNCMQVGCGLLLLSVSAATSLAEERQRGSLDVLLATPLPTRSIVWGKWWGSFRAVPMLVMLPGLVTTAQSMHSGHVWGPALMTALILAYGAALTSLGLAVATWVPRMSRAVGSTVGIYVFMSLGWIPLAMILFGDRPSDHGVGVASASPFMGVGMYSSVLAGSAPSSQVVSQTLWTLFWTIAYSLIALALLFATHATFNQSLGRLDHALLFDDEDDYALGRRPAKLPEVELTPWSG